MLNHHDGTRQPCLSQFQSMWQMMMDCCGRYDYCGCCKWCAPKVYDYHKKHDRRLEMQTLIDHHPVDRASVADGMIRVKVVSDQPLMGGLTFYDEWNTQYWLAVDKVIEYERHFSLSSSFSNSTRSRRERYELYHLLHSCFSEFPSDINEQIYHCLSAHPFIDNIYDLYFQCHQKTPAEMDNANDLGLLINRPQILHQYRLYQSRKRGFKSHRKSVNFWKYIGLNSKTALHRVALIVRNDTQNEIFVSWLSYGGLEQTNSNIYPHSSACIGTHTSNTFAIRVSSSLTSVFAEDASRSAWMEDDTIRFNDLCIVAIYQIRHTYPTHIVTVSSLFDANGVTVSAGSPLRSVPVMHKTYLRWTVEQFTICYEPNVFDQFPTLMATLQSDLRQMNRMLSPAILDVLHRICIFCNVSQRFGHPDSESNGYGLTFHHDPAWMRNNAVMIEKCRHIEIYSADDYLEWRICQPLVLFHEFVHAFHCYIGRDRIDVKTAYDSAMQQHLYDRVQHIVKYDELRKQNIMQYERAYAAANHYEYFAQMSEAYFGQCNYFPFSRTQLKKHDLVAYQLCEKIWSFDANQIQQQHAKSIEAKDLHV